MEHHKRTVEQLRYYRGPMIGTIAERYRMLPEDVADRLKKQYFDGSTRKWNTIEWEEKMKKIRSDFSKKGVFIAKPNEPNESEVYQ